MRNLLILGTGRSGTSMLTGMLRNTGHYLGDDYIAKRSSNPTGFFEDRTVNWINDEIIHKFWLTSIGRKIPGTVSGAHKDRRAYWMASPSIKWHRGLDSVVKQRITERCTQEPFCYKDPRFSVTLPFWRPFLPTNTYHIVVFRDPGRTVESMIRESTEHYKPSLPVTRQWLLKHWIRNYNAAIEYSKQEPERWLFVNYDDIVSLQALSTLEAFTQTSLYTDHINRQISRSTQNDIPKSCRHIWNRLNELKALPSKLDVNLQIA